MKILIAEDANFMRASIIHIIEKYNFEVIEAANGEEAVEKYKANQPDLVTMDITMPKMSGIEAIKEIIKYDKNANIIIVSAMGYEKYVKQGLKAGAKDFVTKPIENKRIYMAIEKMIKSIEGKE